MEAILREISVLALPVLFAITLHEAAHGYVARYFGDPTAWQAGRISLNPLRHIDPVGTILVPLFIYFTTALAGQGFLFGWAKPVPVNFSRLRHPKRDMLWVAAAGPMANLVMAVLWILVANVSNGLPAGGVGEWFYAMAEKGILINVILMVLNLFPLPPLDGGRIAVSLLPSPYAWRFARIEPYGMLILVVLLVTGVLGALLWPLVVLTTRLLLTIFAA
ncbi:site-2 protease family protein [Thiobacter aerophilum]|uniref:Site-2 protease family protein n=1 Tax=Thiobacter aerophilum TaxID=3121275 RepID=A0ABV0EAQ4_9BURK